MRKLRNLDPRSRRQMAWANAALAIGLLMRVFAHPAGTVDRAILDAATGFLLSFSIVANLLVILRARRSGIGC